MMLLNMLRNGISKISLHRVIFILCYASDGLVFFPNKRIIFTWVIVVFVRIIFFIIDKFRAVDFIRG